MKAIILCAGKGTRMAPLTDTTPKPMLKVLDKNLIEWKLEALPEGVTEIIFVVGYKKEKITEYFGSSWRGIPVFYEEQFTLNGTGGAISLCKNYITERTLVLMGDDIYRKEDLEKLAHYDFSMLVIDKKEEFGTKKAGTIVRENDLLVGINEGIVETGVPSSLINTAAYTISKEFFNYELVKVKEDEYGLPQTLVSVTKDHPVHIIETDYWIQITSPKCITDAEERLKKEQAH